MSDLVGQPPLPRSEMEEVQEKILNLLNQNGNFDSLEASKLLNVDHQKIVGGIKSLQSVGNVIFFNYREFLASCLFQFCSFQEFCVLKSMFSFYL